MVCAVGVTAFFIGQWVLGEGFLATEDKLIGNERKQLAYRAVAPGARLNGEVGVEVVDGGGLGLGGGIGELDAGTG